MCVAWESDGECLSVCTTWSNLEPQSLLPIRGKSRCMPLHTNTCFLYSYQHLSWSLTHSMINNKSSKVNSCSSLPRTLPAIDVVYISLVCNCFQFASTGRLQVWTLVSIRWPNLHWSAPHILPHKTAHLLMQSLVTLYRATAPQPQVYLIVDSITWDTSIWIKLKLFAGLSLQITIWMRNFRPAIGVQIVTGMSEHLRVTSPAQPWGLL